MVRIEVQNGIHEASFDGGMVTFGGRAGADVVLRDVMVGDRHCVVTYEDGFVLRDTGTVVGTWVDGARAAPTAPLRDGSQIVIGSTRIRCSIDGDGRNATLRMVTEPQAFWWQQPGKGAFGNDSDRLLLSEAEFGRFPALRLGNRIAIWAGLLLLVAATFLAVVMEPLADPGPLLPAHALVTASTVDDPEVHAGIERCVQLSGEQGCDVCHQTGAGVTERKCAQCHGLSGEMASAGTFRHPYHNDGEVADQQFCVRCHRDHQGGDFLKPVAQELLGDCAACHDDGSGTFDRDALIASADIEVPAPVDTEFAALRFPHDRHLAKDIGCAICHRPDPAVQSDRERGVPDDPRRHDFAAVPFETCASCHVAGSEPVGMSKAQQDEWRATEFQWRVAWHGSEAAPTGGRERCLQCHRERQQDGATVIGPELRTIERDAFDADGYRRERARFTVEARSHDAQFQAHAEGKACTDCHVDGRIAQAGGALRKERPFWHALHLGAGALRPGERAAQVSADAEAGCASCHGDLAAPSAIGLTAGRFHWPDDEAARAACSECHSEGDRALR
ncbi:MAG TPA: FHA domain-containing protein, partial [bacterium]|nr:FHA domain-containing protein [bacterium]